ncbi:sulfatase-like hydrolase/transferase [Pontiella sulfatireligans]|uniref:Arylsulfatase n=1 Tax=Pontiella sulfatireligans TaxID=2750658 RepID=A0A6C2UFV8_9BACT|nr:sulfatase-like hydrolase/transferase [Pontiella sulfatireligans]SPS74151.1 sulfatase S1_19 [Kiritimatiellales bacterium]VGO18311.1 Arylsulfatase [Pontiella sulfatireligans]
MKTQRLTFLLIALSAVVLSATAARPNILIILCDDLGYADVGFNGSKDIPTPTLDALAKNGTVCSSAYAAHPVCGPSRAALLTGRSPYTMGGQFNIPYFNHQWGVSTDEVFLSRVLQKSGYYTGVLGKWHLGEGHEFLPNQRGFDEFYGHLGGGHKYFPRKYWAEYEKRLKAGDTEIPPNTTPQLRNGKEAHETEYLTDAFSREAVSFIKQASAREQPFFLYLAYNAPHAPIEAKQEDIDKMAHIEGKKRKTYAAMVHCVDYGVKSVVEALKETGAYENTLIIFLSDNGGVSGHGACNAPLSGEKRGVEEGGFRVPMFWHWPGVIPANCTFEYPVLTMDFYPTLANLAGASIPADKELDGKDIWIDLLNDRNPHPDELIAVISHRPEHTDIAGRLNEWKAVRSGQHWKLYNLEKDVGEQNDLSSQHPERLQDMVNALNKWAATHQMPAWVYSDEERERWELNTNPWFEGTFDLQ